eukprot:361329-Chlamydomonas_euryale.AAC.6
MHHTRHSVHAPAQQARTRNCACARGQAASCGAQRIACPSLALQNPRGATRTLHASPHPVSAAPGGPPLAHPLHDACTVCLGEDNSLHTRLTRRQPPFARHSCALAQ